MSFHGSEAKAKAKQMGCFSSTQLEERLSHEPLTGNTVAVVNQLKHQLYLP
jgi:hypothetical protein